MKMQGLHPTRVTVQTVRTTIQHAVTNGKAIQLADLDDVDVDSVKCRVVVGLAAEDGCKQASHQCTLEQPGQILLQQQS